MMPYEHINRALIELVDLRKVYGEGRAAVTALDGINISILPGDFIAMMGPSGSGKSTCMNIIGCLDTPSSGSYLFQGVEVAGLSRNELALLRRNYIGFVFQGFNLLPRTSALENVELPLIYSGVPVSERRVRARAALKAVGLEDWESHAPNELSGGQQQRVAIARALVTNPSLILADEPTGNLDTARSKEIMKLLADLNHSKGITIIMVTHESDMAHYAKQTVQFLDGKIPHKLMNGKTA